MELLKIVKIEDDGSCKEPVNHVCYHPIAIAEILKGNKFSEYSNEEYKPICCAVEYDESVEKKFASEMFNTLKDISLYNAGRMKNTNNPFEQEINEMCTIADKVIKKIEGEKNENKQRSKTAANG